MEDKPNVDAGLEGQSRLHDGARKVALIAVHGVGAPKFGETARQIATLLQRHSRADNDVRYGTFDEIALEVPVTPWTDVQRSDDSPRPNDSRHDEVPWDIEFSLNAIRNLTDCDCLAHYRTVKLSGERKKNDGANTGVDIFEMRWADLSSGSRLWTKFLVELYQVYFHLASLGRKTVISGAARCARSSERVVMGASAAVHRLLECLLPAAIPVGNLFFLVPALALVALWVPSSLTIPIAAIIGGLATALIGVWLAYLMSAPYFFVFGVIVAGMVGHALTRLGNSAAGLGYVAMAFGLVVAWTCSHSLLSRYSKAIRLCVPSLAVAICLPLFAIAISQQQSGLMTTTGVIGVAVWVANYIFISLQMMWLALFYLLGIACILSVIGAVVRINCEQAASLRTGRVGALVSTTLFFLTTVLLWSSILAQIKDRPEVNITIAVKSQLPDLLYAGRHADCGNACSISLHEYVGKLYDYTVGMHANVFLIGLGVAVLLAASTVLPSAWYETSPPPAHSKLSDSSPQKLKNWLDRAGSILWPAELTLVASVIALGSGYFLLKENLLPKDDWLRTAGVSFAAAVPLTILLRTRLPKAPAAILDVALDVSNWLKERPFGSNPRGRMMCRYIALLREIGRIEDYDSIVVVAHSQGTIITADLFRMLNRMNAWPFSDERRPNIFLLTAGCPLRQLYHSRFPVWYEWASNPQPKSLGVGVWVNAYRTGDYIGRELWGGGEYDRSRLDWGDLSMDMSIGAGAHTHYFDETAPQVGEIIDWMIENGSATGQKPENLYSQSRAVNELVR